MKPPRYAVWMMLATWSAPFLWAQDVKVEATVSTDVVGVQDQFQLTIVVSGKDSGDAETPRLPRFRGFQVVAGPSVGTQYQWINGRSSSSKSFVYVLLPEKEGDFTIDPVEVRVGGKLFKTEPLSIRVTRASGGPPAPRSRAFDPFGDEDLRSRQAKPMGEEVLISAELDRSSAYLGQQVTLTYHLYTQVSIGGLQLQENPPLNGFWVEDLEVERDPRGSRKVINGKEYLDYIVKRQALFPTRTGMLDIPSATFAVSAKVAGSLFGFFGQSETLYRRSKGLVLEVKPLPAQDRPADFHDAVGAFDLTADLDKKEAAAGDAVSLRIKLSGRGNLKMIPDPSLPPMPDFTIYSSKRVENVRPVQGNLIGGDKTWEYVIVPKAPGRQTIPPFSLSYFDADREKFETLATAPLTIMVRRGAEGGRSIAGLSGIEKQTVTRQGTDINFIKLSASDLGMKRKPIYASLWPYLLAGLPLVFNVGAFLYQRERARQSVDMSLTRSRKARGAALKILKQAEKSGRTEPRRFYDGAAEALSRYLADRYNLPEIAVTGDSLERTLAEKSVNADRIDDVRSCLEECDYGRFVSASSSPEKLRQISRRIRKIVDTLERT